MKEFAFEVRPSAPGGRARMTALDRREGFTIAPAGDGSYAVSVSAHSFDSAQRALSDALTELTPPVVLPVLLEPLDEPER